MHQVRLQNCMHPLDELKSTKFDILFTFHHHVSIRLEFYSVGRRIYFKIFDIFWEKKFLRLGEHWKK